MLMDKMIVAWRPNTLNDVLQSNVVHGQDVSLFTMHDLVHDLARFVMADELFDAGKVGNIWGSSCRYAVLTDCSKPLNLSVVSPSKIRALHFQGCSSIALHSIAFSLAKYMRVLDLSACFIQKLPDSIGELRQLRYLNAPRVQNQVLPMSITNLSKLNYLNLHRSSITELPKLIAEMKCLMYLDLSFCQKINELPHSFAELTQLDHLDLSNCPGVKVIPELLARLAELVHLNLSECSFSQGIGEVLGGLTKLQYLNLSQRFSGVQNLVGLEEGIRNLTGLRYLGLSGSMASVFRSRLTMTDDDMENFIDSISTLPNLEHLNLSRNSIITFIPECIAKLRKLHTLDLSYCDNLGKIPEIIDSMDSLKILNVKGCDQLNETKIFRSNSFALLPHFAVHADYGASSSNIGLLRQAYPDDLKITRLELVKSPEEIQSIKLMKKLKMEKLKLNWTTDAQRSLEDIQVLRDLVPPSTLKEFEIQGYNSKSFPTWFRAIANYLPNLVKIEVEDLPNCNILPPLGQLQFLEKLAIRGMDGITKIDEGFSGGNARAFPRLKEFELSCMESLEEWETMYSCGQGGVKEFMFPNLKELTISECPNLRLKPHPPRAKNWIVRNSANVMSSWGERGHTGAFFFAPGTNLQVVSCYVPLHQWRLLHHLLGLTHLKIEHCSDLSSSSQIVEDLFTLQSLHLIHNSGDNYQPKLPVWFGDLTNLQMLVIDGYPELEAPVEIVEKLTCLQSVRLLHCERMTTLPEWLGGLTSLKHLEITGCSALNNLQEIMLQLTTLHSLTLKNCDSLLSPLEWLGSLFALEELNILDCKGIKSFPESIENLTRLKELQISGCPELKLWCESDTITWKLARIKGKVYALPN
jgi:Leucine-rich repeat (LRR) protein